MPCPSWQLLVLGNRPTLPQKNDLGKKIWKSYREAVLEAMGQRISQLCLR